MFRRDVGGCYGKHAWEFHQNPAGFSYSYDFAFDAFERAFFDFYSLTFPEFVADLGEINKVFVHCRGDCNEVFHVAIRDGQRRVCSAVPVVVDGTDISETADVGVDFVAGPVYENQVAYGWDQFLFVNNFFPHHGDESADPTFGKMGLDLEFAGVCRA